MIIHSPIRVTDKKFTEYTAKINFLKSDRTLVFRIDSCYDHMLTDLSDPFLIALLLPAMGNKEDIEVRGKISERLLKNMQSTVQDILCMLIPGLRKVSITATEVITGSPVKSKNVLSAVSGGVDSFVTFEDYYLKPKTSTKITHFLLNNMCDIYDKKPQVIDNVKKLLNKYNVPLIQTWSNLHIFARWDTILDRRGKYGRQFTIDETHPMENSAIAHLLGGKPNTFLYSSSVGGNTRGTEFVIVDENGKSKTVSKFNHKQLTLKNRANFNRIFKESGKFSNTNFLFPTTDTGGDPGNDIMACEPTLLPLLSTPQVKCESVGTEYTRPEKTIKVADLKDAHNHLDVCNRPPTLKYVNCGICRKCTRVLLMLELINKKNYFKSNTFDLEAWDQIKSAYIQELPDRYSCHDDVETCWWIQENAKELFEVKREQQPQFPTLGLL